MQYSTVIVVNHVSERLLFTLSTSPVEDPLYVHHHQCVVPELQLVHYSTVQYIAVQYSSVQSSPVQNSTV